MSSMRKWITLLAVLASAQARWQLQSNVWVNLHQRLMYEARFGPVKPLADNEQWKGAIEKYRAFLGKRHPFYDKELLDMNEALSATKGAKLPDSIPRAAAAVLESAMPLYRAQQWPEDDRINRFWISVAEPLLASAGEELVAAHEKAYGRAFPKRILVDVASYGWEFGAYTVPVGTDGAHVVMQSQDNPGGEGFYALESPLHQPAAPSRRHRPRRAERPRPRAADEGDRHPPVLVPLARRPLLHDGRADAARARPPRHP